MGIFKHLWSSTASTKQWANHSLFCTNLFIRLKKLVNYSCPLHDDLHCGYPLQAGFKINTLLLSMMCLYANVTEVKNQALRSTPTWENKTNIVRSSLDSSPLFKICVFPVIICLVFLKQRLLLNIWCIVSNKMCLRAAVKATITAR